jgi:hypothetical protein
MRKSLPALMATLIFLSCHNAEVSKQESRTQYGFGKSDLDDDK